MGGAASARKPVEIEVFIASLRKSELLEETEIDSLLDSIDADNVQQLARQLIKRGKLTRYQAGVLARGKSKGLILGKYELLDKVGQGGMGMVFRARHRHMGREVAVKILPAELASEPERLERFEREAQALAALNHPHIVTIHSVEEADGLRFLTMELVEGKTLTKVIPRGGLSLSHFFRIAIPLTEAVSAAHEKGITHRDLKPGNVMVTEEDRVKVLDFGLAKLRYEAEAIEDSEAPTAPATEAGRVMGTAPYMSPEQVQGKAVDHRSDVFSLGIMLYEMVTGDRPFQGDTAAELASSILRDTPASVTERKADLPRDLGRLIKHCLEKEPTRRLQSVLDVRNELEELRREVDTGEALTSAGAPITARRADRKRRLWLVGGAVVAALALTVGYLLTRSPPEPPPPETASAERKMLVVLPFENLGAPEDAYFAAGMTEEITSRLARVSGLGVISRTSAVQYDRAGKTTKQIGEDLGVGFVLVGTVRWDRRSDDAGRVRITPQLIRVADDTHMWADSYDRVLDDIFEAQSEIAQTVVQQLGVTLAPDEKQRVGARPTRSLDAYDSYLKGRFLLNRRGEGVLTRAIEYFEQALEQQQDYAPAYSALADSLVLLAEFQTIPANEAIPRAKALAQNALRIDPALGEAHVSLAYARMFSWDWAGGEESFKRGIELNPSYATGHHWYGFFLTLMGRAEESIASQRRALRLDPLSLIINRGLGHRYFYARRYDEAIEAERRTLELDPNFAAALLTLGNAYLQKGMLEDAISVLQRATSLAGGVGWGDAPAIGFAYAASGQKQMARQVLEEYGALESAKGRYVSPYKVATIHLGLGDEDQAFEWLERAYRESSLLLVYLNVEPLWDPIRPDSRFQDLLRRMNFPE